MAIILLLLVVQAVTGLVLAGTDILYPPFGSWIAHWIAAPNVDPSALTPLTRNLMNQDAYAAMRSFRAPFVKIHELAFYGIAAVVVLHVIAVIVTELRRRESHLGHVYRAEDLFRSSAGSLASLFLAFVLSGRPFSDKSAVVAAPNL